MFKIASDLPECAKKISNSLRAAENRNWICPALLHTFVPYCLTLTKGGRFTWMRNKDKVILQCPHPEHPCVVELRRIRQQSVDKIQGRIIDISPDCSIEFKKGQRIILNDIFPGEFCLLGFDAAFPYLEYMRSSNNDEASFLCSCLERKSTVNLKKIQ